MLFVSILTFVCVIYFKFVIVATLSSYRCPERAQDTLASKPANSRWCAFLLTTLTVLALLLAAAAITIAVIQVSSMKKELTEIREQYSTGKQCSINNHYIPNL